MKQKIKFEGAVSGELDFNFKFKAKKFIKCIDGFINEANSTSGRIYVPHEFIGHKVIILIEEK